MQQDDVQRDVVQRDDGAKMARIKMVRGGVRTRNPPTIHSLQARIVVAKRTAAVRRCADRERGVEDNAQDMTTLEISLEVAPSSLPHDTYVAVRCLAVACQCAVLLLLHLPLSRMRHPQHPDATAACIITCTPRSGVWACSL